MVQAKERRIQLPSRTVAIGLKLNKDYYRKRSHSGERLFTRFQYANRDTFWNNQQLQASIRNMNFVGYLCPHTLLVSGSEKQMDALKSAWDRRLLQAPFGYQIVYFGNLSPFQINVVSSSSLDSLSLPAVLCSIILQLNRSDTPATVSSIKRKLRRYCQLHQAPVPTDQIVFEALNGLLTEKKLCLTDTGYFITREAHLDRITDNFTSQNDNLQPALYSHSSKKQQNRKIAANPLSPQKAPLMVDRNKNLLHAYVNGTVGNGAIAGQRRAKARGRTSTLRRLFSRRVKQPVTIATNTGSSSGCSSMNSPVQSNDEDVPVAQHDSSLTVHCGEQTLVAESDDSDYSDEEVDEADDLVPEMHRRSIKNQRCTGTVHLLKKPTNTPLVSSAESSDTEYYPMPTSNTYFTKSQSEMTQQRLTRHSTELPLTQLCTVTPLPNISSITLCDKPLGFNCTIESTDTSIHSSTRVSSPVPSRLVEGQSHSIPTHSPPSPIVDSVSDSIHIDRPRHHNPRISNTAKVVTTPHHPSNTCKVDVESVSKMSMWSTEKFCDCESVLRCGCSTVAPSVASSNRLNIDTRHMKYLASL